MIYLDYNATTPLASGVFEAMAPYFTSRFGNAASIHGHGQEAMQAVLRARGQVADLVGADRDEVYFTGSGTEAVVTALVGTARARVSEGKHVLISAVEHAAAQEAGRLLRDLGYTADTIPCDGQGRITPQALGECLREDTVLVSVMHANNETGVMQPVQALSTVCKEHGVTFHVDAAQTAGKTVLDVSRLGCDWLSLSAHKLGGPKGVGALVRRGSAALKPHVPGHQEQGLRGGTHNVPGIVGFGEAAARALRPKNLEPLRDHLETLLREQVPSVRITAADAPRLGNTTHLTFPGFTGKDLIPALDMAGFSVSSGSACMSGSAQVSHVLLSMGYSPEEASTAVRVSLGPETTQGDVEGFVEALAALVGSSTGVSP